MNSKSRHIGATLVVALLLVTAGCLGFGGGEEPTPENETPDMNNGTDPVENGSDAPGDNTTIVPDGPLDENMSVAEILERTSSYMTEDSPYQYTMESESETTLETSPESTITNEKRFEATVDDYRETTYVRFTEYGELDYPDRTQTANREGIFFGASNVNATKYDSQDGWRLPEDKWLFPGTNDGYVNPYVVVQQNMDSPTVTAETADTIVLTETIDSFDDRETMANSVRNTPVQSIDSDETEVTVTIRNEENATNVVETIEISRDVTGNAETENGETVQFNSEMTTTVTYEYDTVDEIKTPEEFTENSSSTDNN